MKSILASLTLLLAACTGVPFPEHSPIEAQSQRDFLRARLAASQSSTRVVERASWTRKGEEITLTIYAECELSGELRLAGISDMGATVFSTSWKAGELEILQASEAMPKGFLEDLVADHVVALLPPGEQQGDAVRLADGQTALHYELDGIEVLVFIGEERGSLQLERGSGGKHRSTLELHGTDATESFSVRSVDGTYVATFEVAPWL